MEVICANPGIMFSDQPFGLYTASSANINRLPLFAYGQISHPDAEETQLLQAYVVGLLDGRIKANAPWKFWSREFHFRNDRICLKITDAKSIVDWLDTTFHPHTVILTRHPIAQALSVSKLGWYVTGKGLLRNAEYVARWLTRDLEEFCWEIYRHGSDLQRRTLDWSLENLPLLRQLPAHPEWLYVSYENLITHTPAVVDFLADQLQLPNRRQMVARVGQPSRSTRRESTADRKQMIHQRDRDRLIDSWQTTVTTEDVQSCFRILDRFEITLYRPDSSLPDPTQVARPSM